MYGTRLDRELGTADRTIRFTTARRQEAINEGIRTFNEETGCYLDRVSIALADGTGEYDLETAGIVAGENYLRLAPMGPSIAITTIADGSVRYIEGEHFPMVSEESLNRVTPGWRALGEGTPIGWYLRKKAGSEYVGLTAPPDIPATETWALLFPYVAIPPVLTLDAEIPYSGRITLTPYHDRIVAYAAGQLEKLRKNYQMVDRQMAYFAAGIVKYRVEQAPPNGVRIRLARNPRAILRAPAQFVSA
jgi:hypothetical protein